MGYKVRNDAGDVLLEVSNYSEIHQKIEEKWPGSKIDDFDYVIDADENPVGVITHETDLPV